MPLADKDHVYYEQQLLYWKLPDKDAPIDLSNISIRSARKSIAPSNINYRSFYLLQMGIAFI